MRFRMCLTLLTLTLTANAAIAAGFCCPACGPILQPTWSERLADSDVAVLAQWVSAKRGSKDGITPAASTFEVLQIARDADKAVKKAGQIVLPKFIGGERGELFFLWGKKKQGKIDWRPPKEMSEIAYQYITQAPAPEVAKDKRLRFFLKFFEYPDPLIATDAYIEFAKAPYKDVKAISADMDAKKIRKWLSDPKTLESRIGLYGLMLGLCGTKADIPFLEKKIVDFKQEFRIGVDGVIAGYLMLVGEKGLDLIDRTKLKDTKALASETFSALQAIRIIWTYGDGSIGKDRLRQSMRLLIDRPELVELAIPDLARWQDWSVQDRLTQLYGQKDYDTIQVKRSIIMYLMASTKDVPENPKAPEPPHVAKGRKLLEAIKKKDPKSYRNALRFFL